MTKTSKLQFLQYAYHCRVCTAFYLCGDAPQRPIPPTTGTANYNFKAKATLRLPALIFVHYFQLAVINYISHTLGQQSYTLELKSDMLLTASELLLGNDQSFFSGVIPCGLGKIPSSSHFVATSNGAWKKLIKDCGISNQDSNQIVEKKL